MKIPEKSACWLHHLIQLTKWNQKTTKALNPNSNTRTNILNQKFSPLTTQQENSRKQNNKAQTELRFTPHTPHKNKFPTLEYPVHQYQPHQNAFSKQDICYTHLWSCHSSPQWRDNPPQRHNPTHPKPRKLHKPHQQRINALTFSPQESPKQHTLNKTSALSLHHSDTQFIPSAWQLSALS